MQDSKQQIDGELTTEQLDAVCGGVKILPMEDSSSGPDVLGGLSSVGSSIVQAVASATSTVVNSL